MAKYIWKDNFCENPTRIEVFNKQNELLAVEVAQLDDKWYYATFLHSNVAELDGYGYGVYSENVAYNSFEEAVLDGLHQLHGNMPGYKFNSNGKALLALEKFMDKYKKPEPTTDRSPVKPIKDLGYRANEILNNVIAEFRADFSLEKKLMPTVKAFFPDISVIDYTSKLPGKGINLSDIELFLPLANALFSKADTFYHAPIHNGLNEFLKRNNSEYSLQLRYDLPDKLRIIHTATEIEKMKANEKAETNKPEFIWDDTTCDNPYVITIYDNGKYKAQAKVAERNGFWYESSCVIGPNFGSLGPVKSHSASQAFACFETREAALNECACSMEKVISGKKVPKELVKAIAKLKEGNAEGDICRDYTLLKDGTGLTASWESVFTWKKQKFKIEVELGAGVGAFCVKWNWKVNQKEGGSVGDSKTSGYIFSTRTEALKSVIGEVNASILKRISDFNHYNWAGEYIKQVPEASPAFEEKQEVAKAVSKEPLLTAQVDGLTQIVLPLDVEEVKAKRNPDDQLYGYQAKDKADRQRFKRKLERTRQWLQELPAAEARAIKKMVSETTTPPPVTVGNS